MFFRCLLDAAGGGGGRGEEGERGGVDSNTMHTRMWCL